MLSATSTPSPLSLKRPVICSVSLWPQHSFVWPVGCIVTAAQDTVRNEGTEEIMCGPVVSNQWGNSSRITHIQLSWVAAAPEQELTQAS